MSNFFEIRFYVRLQPDSTRLNSGYTETLIIWENTSDNLKQNYKHRTITKYIIFICYTILDRANYMKKSERAIAQYYFKRDWHHVALFGGRLSGEWLRLTIVNVIVM